jgi:hypothetical protein
MVLTGSLLAWLLFAVTDSRTRQSNRRLWTTVGVGSVAKRKSSPQASNPREPRYSRRDAIQILLTGNAKMRRVIVLVVFLIGAVSLLLTLLNSSVQRAGYNPLMWPFVICMFAGLVPGICTIVMTRRSKFLWLTTGMGRAELFATMEAHCWRIVILATVTAIVLAAPLLALGSHGRPVSAPFLSVLIVPLASGSAYVYVSLLNVRGNRLADHLILAGNALLLAAEMLCAANQSQLLFTLIGIQIILVPLLREVARRRWNNIDWLLIRQPLAAARWS